MRQLYTYFRSSASFRVRIALNLKGLAYQSVPVHLRKHEQNSTDFLALNPAGLVPVLVESQQVLTQSIAIIEYLDEVYPHPSLLPGSAVDRARIRALAQTIACEIHPLNNLLVLNYLANNMAQDEAARQRWYCHWVEKGLAAIEQLLHDSRSGDYCHGDTPTLSDCVLIPQVFNARRFNCKLDHVPKVLQIVDHCLQLTAFQQAAPASQQDAQ